MSTCVHLDAKTRVFRAFRLDAKTIGYSGHSDWMLRLGYSMHSDIQGSQSSYQVDE